MDGEFRQVAQALHRREATENNTNQESGRLVLSEHNCKDAEGEEQPSESVLNQNNDPLPPRPSVACSQQPLRSLGYHWGVQTQVLQGICYCCHLRLPTQALVSEGGITVFPCSHAYHTICLSHRGLHCVRCDENGPQNYMKY